MPQTSPTLPIEISFYPDYREMNPYQTLLYRSIEPFALATPLVSPEALAQEKQPGEHNPIFHLHWETAALAAGATSATGFLDTLASYRDAGGRIIWTVHNLEPHDARHRPMSADLRDGLVTLADIIHFHSTQALAAALEIWSLPLEKVRIIPHGNYDRAYPVISQASARAALGLQSAGQVALLAGQIRAYKQPEALITAFCEMAGDNDRLILAGHLASDADSLTVPDDPRIIAELGFCSAEALARFHAAADFVVLPYSQSLTSGSALLAATLGRGVLGSDTAGLRDAVSAPHSGLLYEPDIPGSLAASLAQALRDGAQVWERRGKAAAANARARDWRQIGATWCALVTELAARPSAHRMLGASA